VRAFFGRIVDVNISVYINEMTIMNIVVIIYEKAFSVTECYVRICEQKSMKWQVRIKEYYSKIDK
jgi:hypothetical protein